MHASIESDVICFYRENLTSTSSDRAFSVLTHGVKC